MEGKKYAGRRGKKGGKVRHEKERMEERRKEREEGKSRNAKAT